jgi:hypothetical protein
MERLENLSALSAGAATDHGWIVSHAERDHTDSGHPGRYLLEELELFADQVCLHSDVPVTFPPGRARLVTNPEPTGSATAPITIGIFDVASLAAPVASVPNATITSTEFRRERRELIALPRRVAVREMYVLAFAPTQLAQPFADSGNAARAEFWREETEQPKPGDLPGCWPSARRAREPLTNVRRSTTQSPDPPAAAAPAGW